MADESNLTENQKKKITKYLEDDGALQRAVRGSLMARKKTNIARAVSNGNRKVIRNVLLSKLQSARLLDVLKNLVCVKFEWCKNRNARTKKYIETIVSAIITHFNDWAGAIAISVLMLKDDFFDELCNCPPVKNP